MTCGPSGCTSLGAGIMPALGCPPAGRTIIGRSTPGYDIRYRNGVMPQQTARQTYARASTQNLGPDLGSFVIGTAVGFVIAAFLLTPTGRDVGRAAGQRTARKIRGR